MMVDMNKSGMRSVKKKESNRGHVEADRGMISRRICIDSTLTVPVDGGGRKKLAKCGRDNEVWRVTHVATLDNSHTCICRLGKGETIFR